MNYLNVSAIKAVDSPSVIGAELSQAHATLAVANLSYMQKQKFDYLFPMFKEETAQLVTLIEGRGRNSWTKVNEKITAIDQATNAEQNYHDALYDNFSVGEAYQLGEIPGIVGGVRRDLGLRPYMSRLRANCENDFFGLFIVHDIYTDVTDAEGETKSKHTGYMPLFKLKPED